MLPASMLGDYSIDLLYRPVGYPRGHRLIFLVVSTCWETRFSSHHYSIYFPFFLFWIIIPAILPATMLGYYSMSASRWPMNFIIIISIYWLSASYRSSTLLRSAKTINRSAAKFTCSYSFGPTCMLFDLSIALRLPHDLFKVAAPTPRSGPCETWVALRPHRPGSWSSLTMWVRPTKRPTDLSVGPTNLMGGPHDLLKTF
jgi:hypothetical protein